MTPGLMTNLSPHVIDDDSSIESSPKLLRWIDKITPNEETALDQLCGDMFYRTGHPFSLIANPLFKNFLRTSNYIATSRLRSVIEAKQESD